ncbi:TetR/AcrR family transcriptional regulator [Pseudoalteromonas sp. SWXJ133]|uniref:TetR/AcrR family transcriptional regulator n=1 Tax=Pseudoalteromonas sp. SWXJ133 TaxID=2792069 RepID=UPI0018CD3EA3|nr:TetR/AcrR family transcriptional regulator [Pseudoalteromonas sp. SWXJ133]MBH0021128.1 TetR/AcrR family transcriptional regulator [Pseudoalteromonas sp. SWXJ133]
MLKKSKFDRQEVINKATNLFWKKGFHATSMRNLQDEIDMRPASIYATFGSKEGLFKEVLRNYTDIGLATIKQCQNEHGSLLESLKALVKSQVMPTQDNSTNTVCMLVKTVNELTEESQELVDITKAHLMEFLAAFVLILNKAKAMGELDESKDVQEIANYLQIQMTGLRTHAKIITDKNELDEMINSMFKHYPF